ncbi:hypothetical protein B0H13DRAFT_2307260 [Mycena leptocephala]|nr:hypothetical protein B0H13DRAFT_2307260 [Mycena leptocephala]
MDQGWQHERKFLRKVCREFHARVNWRVQDHEEPELGEWDASAPLVTETLTDEEEQARGRRVKELNKRIWRWFTYRIRKLYKHRISSGLDPSKNPFAVLLAKLSGVNAPPKARQAYQQFMRESYAEKIAPVVAEKWSRLRDEDSSGVSERTKEPKAGFRAEVAREAFAALPMDEQKQIAVRAKEDAVAAKEAYLKSLKDRPSMKPEDRQRCIDALADFLAPILRGIEEYTGLHSTIMCGGPMPRYGGDLRTLHVSYGRSNTMLGPHWLQWDRPRFATNVTNFMVEYLQTAFTPQDCIRNALAPALAGANYTISPQDDSDSESGSESDSDSDSAVDMWSDEEEAQRSRKKAKLSKDKTTMAGKRHSGNKKVAGKAKARTKPRPSSQSPNVADDPNLTLAAASAASATPNSNSISSAPDTSSHDEPRPHDDHADHEQDDQDEEEEDEEAAPSHPVLPWYQISEEERQANIHRNATMLADLKVAWHEVAEPIRAARTKQPRPRPKVKQPPPGALRRSTRNATEGMDKDVVMADNLPDTNSRLIEGALMIVWDPLWLTTTPSTATSSAGATTSMSPSVNPPPTVQGALIIMWDLHHLTTTPSTATGSAGWTTSTGPCTTDGNTDAAAAPTTLSMSIIATTPSTAISAGGTTSTGPSTMDTNNAAAAAATAPTTMSTSIGTAAAIAAPGDTSATATTVTGTSGPSATPTTQLPPVSRAVQVAIATRSRRSTRGASRARESEGSENLLTMPCPSNAPAWFVDGHAAVTEKDLGCHFHALVAAWTRVEAASRFEHGPTNLPSKHRPKPMSGRLCGTVAHLVGLIAASVEKKGDDGEWSVVGGYGAGGREWGPLYQWGTNGTLTLVASLYFWGSVLGDDVDFRARWEAAVMDVCWMMEGMAAYYELFKGKF